MMTLHKLCVCLYGKHIGTIELDRNQKMTFSYQREAAEAISLSMPLKEKSFDDKNCRKFFRGFFPEDPKRLDAMCHAVDCLPKDTFFLLQQYGKECNGAISFCTFNEVSEVPHNPLIQTHITQKTSLDFKPSDSFGLFSGSHCKIPVCIVEDKISTKEAGAPSTHFIKVQEQSKIINEYFCLCLAKDLKIKCVDAKIYPLMTDLGLLVERYDRKLSDFYHVQYFHQEDFLQALGGFPVNKYEWEKGPSLKECFSLLQKTIVPAVARLQLIKRVIFNYLIGNTQAHGKNMSLLYFGKSKPVLAPLYTAIATCDDSKKMAMKIGEHDVIEEISVDDWKLFCQMIGFTFPIFKQMFAEYNSMIVERAEQRRERLKAQTWDVKEIDKIILAIKKRCERMKD